MKIGSIINNELEKFLVKECKMLREYKNQNDLEVVKSCANMLQQLHDNVITNGVSRHEVTIEMMAKIIGDLRKLERSMMPNAMNESSNSNTIRLQFIDGYFYPTDALSSELLEKALGLGRIPENKLDFFSIDINKLGYKLAIADYDVRPMEYSNMKRYKLSDKKNSPGNPCAKCGINGVCDSDICTKGIRMHVSNHKKG